LKEEIEFLKRERKYNVEEKRAEDHEDLRKRQKKPGSS
jgi:hypothetical protein